MTREHWLFLLTIMIFVSLMLAFSLMHRPESRGYRWIQRCFWSFALVQCCSQAGWLGMNRVTLAVSMLLSWPGCAAMLVVSIL